MNMLTEEQKRFKTMIERVVDKMYTSTYYYNIRCKVYLGSTGIYCYLERWQTIDHEEQHIPENIGFIKYDTDKNMILSIIWESSSDLRGESLDRYCQLINDGFIEEKDNRVYLTQKTIDYEKKYKDYLYEKDY